MRLTGFLCTSSWLFATAVSQMMVITEFRTKEKKRFLCSVILWQLKLLQEEERRRYVTADINPCKKRERERPVC